MRKAFTLAEVLITLGIIGVVAAMTLPSVITNVQKNVVTNKLMVFNNIINNAFRMAQAEYGGNFEDWVNDKSYYSYNDMVEFLNTYLFPYIKYSEVQPYTGPSGQTGVLFRLSNGSLVWTHIDDNGGDLLYFANGKWEVNPRNRFGFQFAKYTTTAKASKQSANFIEPYTLNWDGNRESLKTSGTWACKKVCSNCNYCTKLIQLNNWEIPDDYPW